jgi:hypothetical protein
MKTRDRYPIEIDSATTFRFAVRPGETVGDERVYYDSQDITGVTFQVRSSEYGFRASYPMTFEDGRWNVMIDNATTATYTPHRNMYYVIDAVFASGDVKRLLEGPIRVRPMGGIR